MNSTADGYARCAASASVMIKRGKMPQISGTMATAIQMTAYFSRRSRLRTQYRVSRNALTPAMSIRFSALSCMIAELLLANALDHDRERNLEHVIDGAQAADGRHAALA